MYPGPTNLSGFCYCDQIDREANSPSLASHSHSNRSEHLQEWVCNQTKPKSLGTTLPRLLTRMPQFMSGQCCRGFVLRMRFEAEFCCARPRNSE